jgi:hypothetical protein
MRSVIAGSIWSASHANIAMALRGGEAFPARERIKFERQLQIHGCKQSDDSNKIVRSIKVHPFREIGCKDSVLHFSVVAIRIGIRLAIYCYKSERRTRKTLTVACGPRQWTSAINVHAEIKSFTNHKFVGVFNSNSVSEFSL